MKLIAFVLLWFSFCVLSEKIDLKGKTVLVTGASSGIGEAISKVFAAQGLNVVLTARRMNNLEKIVSQIEKDGGSAIAVAMDVTSEEDQRKTFKAAEAKFGAVHFVVANAAYEGVTITDFWSEKDNILAETEKTFRVNVFGLLITLREGVTAIRKAGGGAVIAVSSKAGSFSQFTTPGIFPASVLYGYAATKAAVDQIVRGSSGLAKENIRVYDLAPFAYASEMAERVASSKDTITANLEARAIAKIPSKKLGVPADIAKIMLTMFDNSTAYLPGGLVYCDTDATWSGHELYKHMYAGPAVLTMDIARDASGHNPYITGTPELKKEL